MATPGKRLDNWTRERIERKLRENQSVYGIAKYFDVSEHTVRKIRKDLLTSSVTGRQ